MGNKIKSQYSSMKDYSDTILPTIKNILKKKKITFLEKGNELILLNTENTKNDILNLINKNSDIPQIVLSVLIDVVTIKNNTYIRQKTK